MKRIKIATWFGPGNYGTGLQALALEQFLLNEGYDVQFIDYQIDHTSTSSLTKIKKVFDRDFWFRQRYKKRLKQKANLQMNYMKKWLDTYPIKDENDIKTMDSDTDLYISGGDQIWNPYYIYPINFLVGVSESIPKISFGSSTGVSIIPEELVDFYRKNLNRYRYIGVREKTSRDAISGIINKEINIVNDPTLLFSGEEWDFLVSDHSEAVERLGDYILCYFVGENRFYWEYVKKICEETGYKAIVVPINDFSLRAPFEKYIEVSPSEFLYLIKNAQIICTDSFHATLFSIQFEKEFYVLKRFLDNSNTSQNNRITDLLASYNISDRMIEDVNRFVRNPIADYRSISNKIQKERNNTIAWLKQTINQIL